jgi:hypothetical protein
MMNDSIRAPVRPRNDNGDHFSLHAREWRGPEHDPTVQRIV